MDTSWECVVIGAGAAGLSGALVLGRARRRTLVIDAGGQSNRVSDGIGGLLGHDGRSPEAFYALGRREVEAYPSVEVREGEVVGATREETGFVLELADGSRETARRVLLATGMQYHLPDVAGLRERWGRSVFHCPFCHGWEHRDEPLGVLDRGSSGTQRALLLSLWSDDVTLLTDGPAELETDDARRLATAGIEVDERAIAGLRGPGDALSAIVFAEGGERVCGGLLVPTTMRQRSGLAEQLGVTVAGRPPLVVDAITVDAGYQTSIPGVSAAGDASVQMPSVANAIAAGNSAAAMIVHGLMAEARGLVPT